jgi:lactate dehydrogenase-like 2-hydroxyacid dehydrogenase
MEPLLVILDDWEGQIRASPHWKSLDGRVKVRFLDRPIGEVADEEIAGARFLMALRERTALNETVFARMPGLELILQTGGHAYHIDVESAKRRHIRIALGRKVKAPLLSVPELTFAYILGLMHKVYRGDRDMREGKWELLTGRTLANRRLGILGMGRHGTRVANIARTAFQMEVVAWDRIGNGVSTEGPALPGRPDAGDVRRQDADGLPRLPLDELLRTSDVVSVHLRLSPESTGLLSADRLALMKPDALLINTSRGPIVDEAALVRALKEGRIGGAGGAG